MVVFECWDPCEPARVSFHRSLDAAKTKFKRMQRHERREGGGGEWGLSLWMCDAIHTTYRVGYSEEGYVYSVANANESMRLMDWSYMDFMQEKEEQERAEV